MEQEILLRIDGTDMAGVLTDEHSPQTAARIRQALPLEGRPKQWGDEYYFPIPVDMAEENGREIVETGTLAYWPEGNAFCIFYGPTPASDGETPRAASPVNVIGTVTSVDRLQGLSSPSEIQVEVLQEL